MTGSDRTRWIDVARGFAIIFVVMHHAGIYDRALFTSILGEGSIWLGPELLLFHMRMPLFFLISGMLASGRFAGSTRGPRPETTLRIARVYVLWGAILLVFAPFWPLDGIRLVPDFSSLPALLWGASPAWYLWAMVVSFAIAYWTRRFPAPAVILPAILVALLLEGKLPVLDQALHMVPRCLPFYLIGFRYPALGGRIAAIRGFRAVSFPLVVYLSLLGASGTWRIPSVLLDLGGIGTGLLLVGFVLRRAPRPASAFAWLGERTLPIYLIHFPVIAVLGCAAMRHGAAFPADSAISLAWVPGLTMLTILLSLGIHWAICRSGGQWLFAPPRLADLRLGQALRQTTQGHHLQLDRNAR